MLALALAIWTVDAILKLSSPSDPQIRPDGQAYAYVYRHEIHVASLPSGGGDRRIALGSRPRWSSDGNHLAYLADQVIAFDPDSGKTQTLTHSPKPVTWFTWSSDGTAIAYLAADNAPDPDPIVADQDYRYTRLYWQKLSGGPPALLTKADRHVLSAAIAPDGKRAIYAAQPTPRNRDVFNVDLYELELTTGKEKPLVAQPGRDGDPSYSPDGRWICFHSQAGSANYFEARHVALIPSRGGPIRYLTAKQSFDVFRNANLFSWSPDGSRLVYTAGRGTEDILVSQDVRSGTVEVLTEGIAGAASFTTDLARSVFLKTSTEHPPEIFYREGTTERQVSHLQDGVAAYPKISSEVVRWKSADGLEVEGVLWLPIGYRPGDRVPMITELHGGPTGTTLNAFPTPRVYPVQVFLQDGIAIFSPNFRGSTNYGAEFRLKNAQSQGVGDYNDVMSGIDAVIAKGIADPNRLGIMGWSYGGYLTGAVITQTNRFKAASIGAPATDWFTYYGQTDGSPDVLWTYFGGSPWEVPENYNRHSSRSKLKDIRTPSLLQVGSNDINHNGEIYRALADHNVPVEYVVYPREGHGISEPAHVRDLLERNLRWFLRWL